MSTSGEYYGRIRPFHVFRSARGNRHHEPDARGNRPDRSAAAQPPEIADAAGTVTAEQSDDLLACLYGLYVLLRLYFVQEKENFFVLAPASHS
jgi:hypothetical protein